VRCVGNRRHLCRAQADQFDRAAGSVVAWPAKVFRAAFDDARLADRSIADIAMEIGFSNLAPDHRRPRRLGGAAVSA
jgi:hypothetical protein